MPQSRLQKVSFSVLMAIVMVYGMEVYNQLLLAGGPTSVCLTAPFADLLPLSVAVLILEHFLGGPLAQRFTFKVFDAAADRPRLRIVARACFTCLAMCPMMSMVVTLAFKHPMLQNLFATWMQTVALNFPMALLWQLLVAGPVVRRIVARIPAIGK